MKPTGGEIVRRAYEHDYPQMGINDDVLNYLAWRRNSRYYLPSLDTTKLTEFASRTFQEKQRQNEAEMQFHKREVWDQVPWQLQDGALIGAHTYYHLDFYETVIGRIMDKEVLGTNSAFNCINVAIAATGNSGESVFGLSHQHFWIRGNNDCFRKFIWSLQDRYREIILVANYENQEYSYLTQFAGQIQNINGRLVAVPRNEFLSGTVADAVVTNCQIAFHFGLRMDSNREIQVINWDEIRDRIRQSTDTIVVI